MLLAGCVTSSGPSGQGGAGFNQGAVTQPGVPAEALFELCWPEGSAPEQRVQLVTLANGEVTFQVQAGASNSTARCIREIAATYPGKRPAGELWLGPPRQRPSGWVVLGYVQLLSGARYRPERGVLDPAPLVSACLSQGDLPRSNVRFVVSVDPQLRVRLEGADGMSLSPLTDSERCIEAVLGATVWPNTRTFTLDFSVPTGGAGVRVAPKDEVVHYFAPPGGVVQGLDPIKVKEAISKVGPAVAGCWETALIRRAGLAGGRSVRLRVDQLGQVRHVSVVGNVSAEPLTAADYLLDRCLVDAVLKARFVAEGAADGVYSWVFAERR